MKKRLRTILKITAMILVICCIAFSAIYLKVTIPSDRELWRITDNDLSYSIIVNELIIFIGNKGDFPSSCEYIYAINKNTGEAVWSSEKLTDEYCDHSWGSVFTAIILISEKEDTIFVSTSYWVADDEQAVVLYMLNGSTGELLWQVEGYAGYPYSGNALLGYSIIDTNYVYVASKEGLFSAIDSHTGKPIWTQKIPSLNYDEDIFIEYHDQIVFYYQSGDHSLTTFDARDGTQIWKIQEHNYVERIIFSEQKVYLVTSSYHDGTVGNPPFHITSLDTTTGKQIWGLSFGEHFSPWVEIIEGKIYVLTSHSEGMFDDFKPLRRLVTINKDTGDVLWEFNEDYSHGDLNYLVQDNVVYVSTKDSYLFALDNKTGRTIWQTNSPCFPYYFHVERNILVTTCEEKYVSAFDTNTGIQKWVVDVGMEKYWYPIEFIITASDTV